VFWEDAQLTVQTGSNHHIYFARIDGAFSSDYFQIHWHGCYLTLSLHLGCFFKHLINGSCHVERLLGKGVMLARENLREAS